MKRTFIPKILKNSLSFKKQVTFLIALFLIPFLLVILSYNIYSVNSALDNKTAESSRQMLQKSIEDIDSTLMLFESFARNTVVNDIDYKILQYDIGKTEAHLYAYSLLQRCKYLMDSRSVDSTVILYSHKNQLYRQTGSSYQSPFIHESLRDDLDNLFETDYKRAQWFQTNMKGNNYMVFILGNDSAHIVCALHIDSLLTSQHEDARARLVVTDSEMEYIASENTIEDKIEFKPAKSDYYLTGEKKGYLAVQEVSEYSGLSIFRLVPVDSFFSRLNYTQLVLLLASVGVILMIPLLMLMLRHIIFTPLDGLVSTMHEIKDGKLEAVLEMDTNITEYREINTLFNDMMTEIKELKVQYYEQALDAQQEKLQYLHMQIQPHFYLNCLKNLYGLAQQEEYKKIQELLLYLSDYLRNTFEKTESTLPLFKELEQVRTYIKLQNITAPQEISCSITIDENYKDHEIPTLSILTFVENSIKHGMASLNEFKISITAREIKGEEKDYLNISVCDDGKGFSEDILEKLNSNTHLPPGSGIGISNVKKRLRLLYGDSASVFFTNARGACTEVFIPITPKKTMARRLKSGRTDS